MKVLIAILVAVGPAGAAWWGYERLKGDINIDVPASDLQTKIAAQFPLRKCMLACVEFHSPVVQLMPSVDRVTLATQLRASLGPMEVPGKVAFDARLRYDPQTTAVYLADIRIPEAELVGVPPEVSALVKQHGPLIASAALMERPIYKLSDAGAVGDLAKRGLKSMQIIDGKLRLTFQWLKP